MAPLNLQLWRPHPWATAIVALLIASLLPLAGCGGADGPAAESDSAVASKKLAASAGVDAANTGAATRQRKARSFIRKGVVAIAQTPDGKSIGVAADDGAVKLLDASNSRERWVSAGSGTSPATGVLFSADGKRLVSVSRDSVVSLWDVATGNRTMALRGHEAAIRAVASSADGGLIASAGEETRILLWDAASGRLKKILAGHADFVNSVSFNADSHLMASGAADSSVFVWDMSTGKVLRMLRGHSDEVNSVAFSPDGKTLASAGEDMHVVLWDLSLGKPVLSLNGHDAAVRALAFSADGSLLASGDAAGKIMVWDMGSRQPARSLFRGSAAVNTLVFDSAGTGLLFAGSEDNQVVAWNVVKGQVRQ